MKKTQVIRLLIVLVFCVAVDVFINVRVKEEVATISYRHITNCLTIEDYKTCYAALIDLQDEFSSIEVRKNNERVFLIKKELDGPFFIKRISYKINVSEIVYSADRLSIFKRWSFRFYTVFFVEVLVLFLIVELILKASYLKFQSSYLKEQEDKILSLKHDIRGPINALESLVSKQNIEQAEVRNLVKHVKEISNAALESLKTKFYYDDFEEQFLGIINELSFINPSLKIDPHFPSFVLPKHIHVPLSAVAIKRMLNNMLINSSEGGASSVGIHLFFTKGQIEILVRDNGQGFPFSIISEGVDKWKTSKIDGSGLGLYFIKDQLEKNNGSFEVYNDSGACIRVRIPFKRVVESFESDTHIILIDDDKFVRLNWDLSFRKNNTKLISFSDFQEESIMVYPKRTIFFLDQNLNGAKGTDIAKKLKKKGYSNIYLTTSYSEDDLNEDLSCVKAVLSKKPIL